jgi:hypothetical protein
MKQVARNLMDPVDGFLRGAKYLIHDRDPLFTQAFVSILATGSVKSGKSPAQSPNRNPYSERFVLSIKSECLDRLVHLTVPSSNNRTVPQVVTDFAMVSPLWFLPRWDGLLANSIPLKNQCQLDEKLLKVTTRTTSASKF